MDKDAGMTILDIGLLTGYNVDTEDLNKVSHLYYLLNNNKACECIALMRLCSCSCPMEWTEPLQSMK